MAYVTPDKYSPYPRACDICGQLRSINTMRKLDGQTFVCDKHTGERTKIMLDTLNAHARPPQTWPNSDPKPQNPLYPNRLEADEAELFNFIDQQITNQARYERVVSGDGSPLATDIIPTMAWASRYLYDLIIQNTRPERFITRGKQLLATAADYLLSRQYGSGLSTSSTRATDAFFGGFLESGSSYFMTNDAAGGGLALLYAYRVLGTATYLVGARNAASYLRNVQAIGSNGTNFTSSDAAGTARLNTGALTRRVYNASGFYSDHAFYPSGLLALEFWKALTTTDGDQSIGATAVVTGFDTAPARLMSVSMSALRDCWEDGIRDAAGETYTGLSSTTPREFFNAYPETKPNFTTGTGRWEFYDGSASTGTMVTAQNFAMALMALYNYEGASSQVTTVSDWLRTFESNEDFETPEDTSASVLARSTTGEYDPTISLSTLLLVRDADDDYSAIKMNGSSLYDWGAFGMLSPLWASRNTSTFRTSRVSPLNVVPRYSDGTASDGLYRDRIYLRGLSGLTYQTAFDVNVNDYAAGTAYEPGGGFSTTPSTEGLVLWCGGEGSVITSQNDAAGDPRAAGWTNLVYPINGHLFSTIFGLGDGPYTGLDTLDGKPSLTWRYEVDRTQNMNLDDVAGSHTPTVMKDRNGNNFGYGANERQARTFIAVMTPRYASNVFDITGGVVAAWTSSPNFLALFDQDENSGADDFYLFSSAFDWRAAIGTAPVLQGPDTPGGVSGIYNGVPLIGEWSTSGSTDISVSINDEDVSLTPSAIDLTPVGAAGWILGNRSAGDQISRWKGTMTELLVYDYKLTGTARDQTFSYLQGRYPSVYGEDLEMVNDAVRAAQFGRSFREAH